MWYKLSMSQRSELMGIYVKGGMNSLGDMKLHYNSFADGGIIHNIKDKVKDVYYQNIKPNVDKIMTNPTSAALVAGIPGLVTSYLYKPDFDARKAKTQDEAYNMARSTGAKTFIWNGDHYNTDYKGDPNKTLVQLKQEELDTYGITNEQTLDKSLITERLHNNLNPFGYENPIKRVFDSVILNKKDDNNNYEKDLTNKRKDHFNLLLGYPQKNNTFSISDYKPKNGSSDYYLKYNDSKSVINMYSDDSYNKLKNEKANIDELFYTKKIDSHEYNDRTSKIIPELDDIRYKRSSVLFNTTTNTISGTGANLNYFEDNTIPENKNINVIDPQMGTFTVGKGKDYLSYYDKWDINPFGIGNDKSIFNLGKPLNIYDRKYNKKK